jgi:iron complex outermembrane receptor protein
VAGEQSDARARDERYGVDNVRRQIFPNGTAGGHMTTKRFTVGLMIGALLLSASSAFADDRTEAKAHFKKGMQAIADGKYEEGISELQRAYEIRPHPNVLYNIARAYAESGDLEGAVANYQKYLDGNPPDKDEVAQVLTALQSRMERQKLIQAASQQAAPVATPGATPGTTTPGTTPATTTPGTTTATPRETVAQQPGGPSSTAPAPQTAVNVGAAKTEDVFEESVVTASKGAQSPLDAPNSTSIITEQDIHLSGITKIPELLRRLAGVDIMEDTGAQTDVSLRGFNQRLSNKVLVLVDGRSVFADLTASTFWETLPIGVEDVARIEVVRGPGSALYGADAFNGVINIITKAPGEGKSGFTVGYGDHNTAHGTISATGRDRGTAYRFSAGFDNIPRWDSDVPNNRVDAQVAGGAGTGFVDQNTAQKSVRMTGNVTQDLGAGVTAGVGGGYINTAFNMGGFNVLQDIDLTADVTDATAFVSGKNFDVHAFFNRFRGDFSINDAYVGQSLTPTQYNIDIADIEAQYIDDRQWKNASNNLHVGLGYRYRYAEWGYLDETRQENFEAAYLHDELKLGKRWAAVGDLRGDYVPYLGKIIGSPKASVLFHPSAQSTIRGIAATAFRVPSLFESYINAPVGLPESGASATVGANVVGNQKVKAEQVASEEIGYLNSESDYFTFDSALFHNYVNNLIDLSPNRSIAVGDLTSSNAGNFQPASGTYPALFGGFENQCQHYNVYGGEFGIRVFPADGVDFYANYTVMSVKEDTSGCTQAQLVLLSPDARTSTNKLNTGIQLRTKFGLNGSIDFHYVSPQDWAEQVTNVQAQRIQYETFHLPAYTLLNARVGYLFLQNHAELSAVAFNLLDDKHREHPFGNVVGQRFMGIFSYHF